MKKWILLTLTLLALSPVTQAAEKNKGNLSNLVVFLRFADEGDTIFAKPASHYETLFNDSTTGANSVYNYFKEASYNQLYWRSLFYPTADAEGHIVPVRMTRKGVEARPIPAAGKAR